jgi:HK97 family phage portal protein
MASIFDLAYTMFAGIKPNGRPNVSYEVYESNLPQDIKGEKVPNNVLSIYTAAKILSGSIAQMSVDVFKNSEKYTEFSKYNELRYRMNEIQNNQTFWSTLEYHRNTYGNAFVDLRKGRNTIIHPSIVTDYDFKGAKGTLRFKLDWSSESSIMIDRYNIKKKDEWVAAKDLLHFKGMSVDGVFGLPPVSAAAQAMGIMDVASNTILSFYRNRAMSPMALESTIDTAAGAKATLEGINTFNSKYTGSYNAGKTIQLPPNTKLNPLSIHFRDAELVATMRFTKEEIYTMYGIPSYMYSSSDSMQADIDFQTLSFQTFTLSPIVKMYEAELEYKLLTPDEMKSDVKIEFDMTALLASDLNKKASAYRSLVTAGILSPDEASEAMGFGRSGNENMDKHFLQIQNQAIEDYTQGWGTNPVNIEPIKEEE